MWRAVSAGRLVDAAEGLMALLFPFTWQNVYIPTLPLPLLHYMRAPIAWIIGLRSDDMRRHVCRGVGHQASCVHVRCRTVCTVLLCTVLWRLSMQSAPARAPSLLRSLCLAKTQLG